MKFRCKMTDPAVMRDFRNIITAISKMSKQCVLTLTPEEIRFTIMDDRTPVLWAVLTRDYFFSEYIMAGGSEENNKIYLEFDPNLLTKSLASLKASAKSVRIKLTNKQQPCLTLDIELPSMTSDAWLCVHDVPIKIIPRKEWAAYEAPDIPEFHISIDLPQLKYVRNVVEKMKNMSPYLTVTAKNNGQFVLKIETNSASVATHFQDLRVLKQDDNEDRVEVSASVDIRKYLNIQTWDAIHPDSVQCNILDDKMVSLYLNMNDNFQIHYFIPAVMV